MRFNRTNNNPIMAWWWTVDRLALICLGSIIFCGAVLVASSSPAIAERIGFDSFYFIKRQLVFLVVALSIMFSLSLLSPNSIRRFSVVGFACGIVLLLCVLLFGAEINGARRWISLLGFSLQPSELMKPLFIVSVAWMLAEGKRFKAFRGFRISTILYAVFASLLILQPDFGMVVVVSSVWAGQIFLAGLPFIWILVIMVLGIIGVISAYNFLPHVAFRIDSFLTPDKHANYQAQKSLEAFHSGGITGKGPGEGVVKQSLPDSHTDFIFAVAGEELGAVVSFIIVLLYAFVVVRGLRRLLDESDIFIVYAVGGLLMLFGLQAMVNMGVSLNLLPTKGMTLPFISYGGSSMLGMAITMGMVLSLTRRRFGAIESQPRLG